jgi:hypothetical protein
MAKPKLTMKRVKKNKARPKKKRNKIIWTQKRKKSRKKSTRKKKKSTPTMTLPKKTLMLNIINSSPIW